MFICRFLGSRLAVFHWLCFTMNHRFWRSISELRHIKILSTSPACTSCAWDKRTACSKYFKPTFLNLVARLHYCSVGENRRLCSFAPVSYNNHKLLVRSPVIQCAAVRTTAQSSSARSFGQPVNEDKGYIPTDLGSVSILYSCYYSLVTEHFCLKANIEKRLCLSDTCGEWIEFHQV